MTTFDHQKLIDRDPREVARFRSWLVGMQRGEPSEIGVEHEADNSCCRRDPWNETLAQIVSAVKPPSCPLVMVNLL